MTFIIPWTQDDEYKLKRCVFSFGNNLDAVASIIGHSPGDVEFKWNSNFSNLELPPEVPSDAACPELFESRANVFDKLVQLTEEFKQLGMDISKYISYVSNESPQSSVEGLVQIDTSFQVQNSPGPFFQQPQIQNQFCSPLMNQAVPQEMGYSDEFFKLAFQTHQKYRCYERTKKQLEPIFPFLEHETLDSFKKQCAAIFPIFRAPQKPKPKNMMEQYNNGFNHELKTARTLYRKNCDGTPSRKGPWSEKEVEQLILAYESRAFHIADHNVHWGNLAQSVPGRTGQQCYDKMMQIQEQHPELIHLTMSKFEIYQQPALQLDVERQFAQEIRDKIESRCLVTTFDIGILAYTHFYSPLNLALKAAIISFIKENKPYKNVDGEYNDEVRSAAEGYLEIATQAPQRLIEDFQIKEFVASAKWISCFLKRNKLSLRKPRYKRRGAVNPDHIDAFLRSLASAIKKHGPSRVFNMDETFVRLRSFSEYVIAEKGQKDVIVEHNHIINEKAGTTFIATVSMDPNVKVPLACVAKGKTKRCENKYGITDETDDICFHSTSGWTTLTVMIQYLNWLHDRYGDGFALVLDVYSAHRNKLVQDYAALLKIDLIFVPANGTGEYQPLDRIIFGIAKQKINQMRRLDPMPNATNEELYHASYLQLKSAMDQMRDEAIKEAWNIAKLDQYLEEVIDTDDLNDLEYLDAFEEEPEEEFD